MVDLKRTELRVHAERAILIQVASGRRGSVDLDAASMEELSSLARTARATVAGQMCQTRVRPDPHSYFGHGKVKELAGLCRATSADLVICDDELRPAQVKALESELDVKVIDRSELILDVFATHARTQQAKLQVELAQLEYALPRLKKMWTHLDRMAGGTIGGGIGVRGPGEKQLEMDRRLVQKRIHDLKGALARIQMRRQRMAKKRQERFTTVALVGYTNAGKSTLMNALTGAGVSVRDRLFETLDTRTRLWTLPDGRQALLSDTVGFIRKLPHHLVASFHATLEEAIEADLLLHVADAASPTTEAQIDAVNGVLNEIGCGEKPVLLALNKTDALQEPLRLPLLRQKAPWACTLSALSGDGLDGLAVQVQDFIDSQQVELTVETGAGNGRLLALLHEKGYVLACEYDEEGGAACLVRVPQGLKGVIESLGGRVKV